MDQDKFTHKALQHVFHENFSDYEIFDYFDAEEAQAICKQQTFSLIIIDSMCPDSFNGESFIREQRQFYSINKDCPILIFTEDIEFVIRTSEEFDIHPETKLGVITKLVNPIKMALKVA